MCYKKRCVLLTIVLRQNVYELQAPTTSLLVCMQLDLFSIGSFSTKYTITLYNLKY